MLMDATSILYWGPFPPTGIQRLEAEIVRAALDEAGGRIGFFVFDRRLSRCRKLTTAEMEFLGFCTSHELAFDGQPESTSATRFFQILALYAKNPGLFSNESGRAAAQFILRQSSRAGFAYAAVKTLLRVVIGLMALADMCRQLFVRNAPDLMSDKSLTCIMSFQTMMKARNAYEGRQIDCTLVCLFYDTIPLEHSVFVHEPYRRKYEDTFRRFIAASAGVISISQAAEDMAVRWSKTFGIHSQTRQFLALRLTSSLSRRPVPAAVPKNAPAKDYVIYCSTIEPRKNHKLLAEVWSRMYLVLGEQTPLLVLAGRFGWMYDELLEQIRDRGLSSAIDFRGSVSDSELKWLYAHARFAVFPSFVEGWGLGATEALDAGLPVVISTDPALAEATQGLMPAIDPKDADGWAAELISLATDEAAVSRLREVIRQKYRPGDIRATLKAMQDFAAGF